MFLDCNPYCLGKGTRKDNQLISSQPAKVTSRQKIKVYELVKDKGAPPFYYKGSIRRGLASLTIRPVIELQVPHTLPLQLCSDIIWHSGWMISEAARPRLNWSGFMQQKVIVHIQNQTFFSSQLSI